MPAACSTQRRGTIDLSAFSRPCRYPGRHAVEGLAPRRMGGARRRALVDFLTIVRDRPFSTSHPPASRRRECASTYAREPQIIDRSGTTASSSPRPPAWASTPFQRESPHAPVIAVRGPGHEARGSVVPGRRLRSGTPHQPCRRPARVRRRAATIRAISSICARRVRRVGRDLESCREKASRLREWLYIYFAHLKPTICSALFTLDTREAYEFFAGNRPQAIRRAPVHRAPSVRLRLFFTRHMNLSPARRVVYAASLIFSAVALACASAPGRAALGRGNGSGPFSRRCWQ